MGKLITQEEILAMNNVKLVESCNKDNCVIKDTKLIIVGTLTPPEGNGYFYTAPRNKIYTYLDKYFNNNELTSLKKELANCSSEIDKKMIINKIRVYLMKHKVAFLDVMKYAIRKDGKENSSRDEDIQYYCLDYESFIIIKDLNNVKIICNSRLAEKSFNEIMKRNNIDIHAEYLTQFWLKVSYDDWKEQFERSSI